MLQTVFFIKLLLLRYAAQSQVADCNQDVSLECPYDDIDGRDFLSVTWYKLNNEQRIGIIRRKKGSNETQPYNFTRPAKFGEKYSLLLPGVTPEDSGSYDCSISAKIGGKNLNQQINLTINECVTQAEQFNATLPSHVKDVKVLPVMWSILGYVAVGLVKVLLSLISIWIIQIWSSRRWQHRW
ncbi:uncharacterized protein LOC118317335 [Scophthalmus maximus]|uniref:Solute carrier family 13 member 3 n=1 Tax=Scophthalmus maximus TaxID=52904 RepID=A0A8D3E0F3_SCOMX|nr:uncharacterized protein LOC118317335 [Scophthalmus maximus]